MAEMTMGEEAGWTSYQRLIAEHTRDADPRHVEAWLRVEYPTLDGLSRRELIEEIDIALACAREAGAEQSEALAASFGL